MPEPSRSLSPQKGEVLPPVLPSPSPSKHSIGKGESLSGERNNNLSETPPPPHLPAGPGRGHKKQSKESKTPDFLKRWNEKGSKGFWNWCSDVTPHILSRSNEYIPFEPTEKQREQIEEILKTDEQGRFINTLSLVISPRRHGKSLLFVLLILWLATSRQNRIFHLHGTTESHTRRTMFNTIIKTIKNTPKLNRMFREDWFRSFEVTFSPLQNIIEMQSGINIVSAFGEKISGCLWCSDLHAALELDSFNALQAALLDSEDSFLWIDSNVDHSGGPVEALQKEAEIDEHSFADYVSYESLEEFFKKAPPWISREGAKRLQRTSLPTDFARDILGKRVSARNSLFQTQIIEQCMAPYKYPVDDITKLTQGRNYKIGAGLDRAKSLLSIGDATVWSVVLKVASPDGGEPEYFVLNSKRIFPNTDRAIKKVILQDFQKYNIDNITIENYETASLAPFLTDQKIPFELLSATPTNQTISFTEFYRIAKEGRFHFSKDLQALASEMGAFSYWQRKGGQFSFGSSSRKHHDDFVYATNYGIFSLREKVLASYTVGNVQCLNKGPKRNLCFIMNQDPNGALLLCRARCGAYREIEEMYQSYKQSRLDSDETIQEFFAERVKIVGARISQAV